MPRKRRPTPPLPGSIPPRTIAPKPSPDQLSNDESSDKTGGPILTGLSSHSSTGSDSEPSSCGVPQCTVEDCRLPTHLSYSKKRKLALIPDHTTLSSPLSPTETSAKAASSSSPSPSIQAKLSLPVEDASNPDFQHLFTQFFNYHFDRLALIYWPQRKDPVVKQNVYRLALHNPVYCLTLIAQAHMGNIKGSTGKTDSKEDQLTDLIYTKLLKMTRERIETFDIGDVDVLLLAIVALCEYDLKLDHHDALRSHHNGMTALVSKRGGAHNLGLSMPYVLRMDRFLAVRANQVPQFASPELPALGIIIQKSSEDLVYGANFLANTSRLSEHVLSFCSDSAQLLELMDELDVTFDPSKVSPTVNPKMEYFYFLRENVDVRHAILNHRCISNVASINKDLLALTATKIVTYYVVAANYLPVVTTLLASRLWNALTRSAIPPLRSPSTSPVLERSGSDSSQIPTIDLSLWTNDMPMLLWLLFACALPGLQESSFSLAGHPSSSPFSPGTKTMQTSPLPRSRSPPESGLSSASQRGRPIHSPSSPRRHRYLPTFILHVAEQLVGERPLSGAKDWNDQVMGILEGFVWIGGRLETEFVSILECVHETVIARAEKI